MSSNIISPSLDTSTQSSSIDFKAQYLKWESLAKRHYNSLTNTGYRVEEGGKDKFGGNGQSLSNSNYIRQKKALREAQAEMQKFAKKPLKMGFLSFNQSMRLSQCLTNSTLKVSQICESAHQC